MTLSITLGKPFPPAADEKVAKVFLVVGDDLRKCYICDQLFTRQDSYEHSKVTCYPPVSHMN